MQGGYSGGGGGGGYGGGMQGGGAGGGGNRQIYVSNVCSFLPFPSYHQLRGMGLTLTCI